MPPDHRACCTEAFHDHAPGAQAPTRLVFAQATRAACNPERFDRSKLTRPHNPTRRAIEYTDRTLVRTVNASYNRHTDQLHAAQQG